MSIRNITRIVKLNFARRKAIKRAKKAGFKPEYPTTPTNLTNSTYLGYKKKVYNWRAKLSQFEKSSLTY